MYHNFFIHSSVDGHLGCFHVLAIINSAAINMPANLENSAVATGLEKVSFHYNPKVGPCHRIFKYYTIALISHASKVMLKILQARLQQ